MHRMTAVALALALTLPAAAAEKFDPDARARARAVAPFVDGQTVAVARVDLTRIDADALVARFAEVGKLDAEEAGELRRALRNWLAGLTRAGARELYVIVSLADLPTQAPFVV